ncbi:MAG: hypothetical protein KKA81_04245 [Bacteroidetes bacterium]|nr:hypothetical protein [Bacteroidota bacterium]
MKENFHRKGNEIRINDLEKAQLPKVVALSRKELGDDYLYERDFLKCLNHDKQHFCKVATQEDGHVLGFVRTLLFDKKTVAEYLKLPENLLHEVMPGSNRIGILDSMAVNHDIKKMGLGRKMLGEAFGQLSLNQADAIVAMAWKDIHGITNAHKLLDEFGLKPAFEIKGYWNTFVGGDEGHHCPVCKVPPCECYGVLYSLVN